MFGILIRFLRWFALPRYNRTREEADAERRALYWVEMTLQQRR